MAKFDDLALRYMKDLIRDFGLPDFQAAGIVGNGGAESGGFEKIQEINPTVKGSAGGLGHFQWTGRTANNRRRLNFEEWLAQNADKGWTAHTYEANYSMLFRELKGPESAALAALRQTRDLEEATKVFCLKFERPGILHMDSRIRWARRALAAYKARPSVIAKTAARDATIGGAATGAAKTGETAIAPATPDAGLPWMEILIVAAIIGVLVFVGSFAWRWWKARQAANDSAVATDAPSEAQVSDTAPVPKRLSKAENAIADDLAAGIAARAKARTAVVKSAAKPVKRRKAKQKRRA